jgi:hypothetical protein
VGLLTTTFTKDAVSSWIRNGYPAVVQWLVDTFGLTSHNVRSFSQAEGGDQPLLNRKVPKWSQLRAS